MPAASSNGSFIDWETELYASHREQLTAADGTVCASRAASGSPIGNALKLYSQLPQGAFSADHLLQLGTVQTALGYLQAPDASTYALTFFEDTDGRVCTDSGVFRVCIVESYKGCNGWVHVADGILVPNTPAKPTQETLYDVPSVALEPWNEAILQPKCTKTLLQAVNDNPLLSWNKNMAIFDQETLKALNDSSTSLTMLAVTKSGIERLHQLLRPGAPPFEDEKGIINYAEIYNFTTDETVYPTMVATAAYNMLPRPYCLRELLQMQQVGSIYGDMFGTKESLNIQLSDGNDASITVKGMDAFSGNILSAEVVCNSVLYVVDGMLGIVNVTGGAEEQANLLRALAEYWEANSTQLVGPPPVCNGLGSITYNNTNELDSLPFFGIDASLSPEKKSGGGGLSAGVIVAIATCSVVVPLLVLLGFSVVQRRTRRKRAVFEHHSHRVDAETQEGSAGGAAGDADHTGSLYRAGRQNSVGLASSMFSSLFSGVPAQPGWILLDSPGDSTSGSTGDESGRMKVRLCLDPDSGKPLELGRGGYGIVYRGELSTGEAAAIKVMSTSGPNDHLMFRAEADILHRLQDRPDANVVRLYGLGTDAGGGCVLVTELMEGGDLREALSSTITSDKLHWNAGGWRVAADIAAGVAVLHECRVIHRDLKSKNVLLTPDLRAKIADVGLSAIRSETYLSSEDMVGTLAWSAPEMLLGQRCTEKVDIYSLGIVLWEIATGCVPRRGFISVPPTTDWCPPGLRTLIRDCTNSEPRSRPTAAEVHRRILEISPPPCRSPGAAVLGA
jgi:hypothetical protein